jgi:hypothetical protein
MWRNPLVDGSITTTNTRHNQGLCVLFYRAAIDLPRSTLNYLAGLIRRHRKTIGSAWRLLNPGQQALLVLADLRKDETFSGKHRVHGMNVQVIAAPNGTIPWTSSAMPGKSHDLTAARVWGTQRELDQAGILTLADKGYQGADFTVMITPYKGKNKPESQKSPTVPMPISADPANARTRSSSHGGSSASSAAVPTRPATSSKPSPSYRTTALKSPEDEMGSFMSIVTGGVSGNSARRDTI